RKLGFRIPALVLPGDEVRLRSAHQGVAIKSWFAPLIAGSPSNLINEITRIARPQRLSETVAQHDYQVMNKGGIVLNAHPTTNPTKNFCKLLLGGHADLDFGLNSS